MIAPVPGHYILVTDLMYPQPKGGGHIVFGADLVGVGVGVRVASFPHVIF